MITALGYIGIRATKPEEWPDFAGKFLGMQQVDSGGGTSLFRMDDRAQRLIVTPEASDGLHFMGWEVDDFAATIADLEAKGVRVQRGHAAERHVTEMAYFHDPAGNRLEIFTGAHLAQTPFTPGRPISGFNTGPLGMGHAVLTVPDMARATRDSSAAVNCSCEPSWRTTTWPVRVCSKVPKGPSTEINPAAMVASTPLGSSTGYLAIRDI
jgi:catechol 2,3-dioxygenase-like lactoylglutathione lyase family enzyme